MHDPSFNHDFTSSSSRGKCYAEDQAQGASDDGYVLFTIGLGAGVDSSWLTDLAALGGGEYVPATDVTELEAAFQQVAQLIQIRLLQ